MPLKKQTAFSIISLISITIFTPVNLTAEDIQAISVGHFYMPEKLFPYEGKRGENSLSTGWICEQP